MWLEMGRKAATPSTVFLNPSLLLQRSGSAAAAAAALPLLSVLQQRGEAQGTDADSEAEDLEPAAKRMRLGAPPAVVV